MTSRTSLSVSVLILCCWFPLRGQSHQQYLRNAIHGIWWSPDMYQSAAFQVKDSTIYYPDDFAEYRYNISGDTIVIHRDDAVVRSIIVKATADSLILSSFGREWVYTRTETKKKTNRTPLNWLLGEWEGVRRDGADGTESRLTTTITPILDGKGQKEELEVTQEKSVYRGFSVRMPAKDDTWINLYMNSVRPGFVQLDGRIKDGSVTWTPHTPNPSRLSHSIVEPIGNDGFRRTMYVSEDGGKSWKVLWTDEARRR